MQHRGPAPPATWPSPLLHPYEGTRFRLPQTGRPASNASRHPVQPASPGRPATRPEDRRPRAASNRPPRHPREGTADPGPVGQAAPSLAQGDGRFRPSDGPFRHSRDETSVQATSARASRIRASVRPFQGASNRPSRRSREGAAIPGRRTDRPAIRRGLPVQAPSDRLARHPRESLARVALGVGGTPCSEQAVAAVRVTDPGVWAFASCFAFRSLRVRPLEVGP